MTDLDNELRSKHIRAGQTAARAKGITQGGNPQRVYFKVTSDQEKMIVKLVGKGEKIACVARTTGLSRPTIYRVTRNQTGGWSA